jgi:nucleoside-diphosphate-sugar epimerase
MTKLIFGCGYLGSRVAQRWRATGETVWAATRSPERAEKLVQAGLVPLVIDILHPWQLQSLPPATTVLLAVGYDRSAGVSIERVYVEGLGNVLQALPPQVERLLYVSSTGVYGQADGSWVDEQSACRPSRPGGEACLKAERLLRQHALGERSIIFRMAGIYGPGRIPRVKDLAAGRPIAAPCEGYLNLIHVEDAADAILLAERDSPTPATYCIADDHPCRRGDYYAELARLIDAPEPVFTTPPAGSAAEERAGSSKRVSSRCFATRFGHPWRYPSFREGLAAIVAQQRQDEARNPKQTRISAIQGRETEI